MMQSFKPASANKGFTLVEVLVTVVIFSVGLLGLAGLQATGIKLNHSSLIRSQATLLAYDIVDSMRANRTNVAGYALARAASAPTTPTTQAQRDLSQWLTKLGQALPGGAQVDGEITLVGDCGSPPPLIRCRATVDVYWDELRSGSAQTAPRLTVVSEI